MRVWYGHDSAKLSRRARDVLRDAIAGDGLVVSVVSLVELWYVTQTTQGVNTEELAVLRQQVNASPTMYVHGWLDGSGRSRSWTIGCASSTCSVPWPVVRYARVTTTAT